MTTGLLTARCDPYGAESKISLMGGLYPETMVGRIMWHCDNRAQARYRMICRGGEYGERPSAGLGQVAAYTCPGGHQGQVMALCVEHRQEISRRQAGMCPRCMNPEDVRQITEVLEDLQRRMQYAETIWNLPAIARLSAAIMPLQDKMTEFYQRGIVHRCPLELFEVS